GAHGANQLDLSTDPYTALVRAPSVNAQAKGEGMPRVKPCDPDHSSLMVKLLLPPSATDATVGYGAHMPQNNGAMAQAQLDAIRAWIARGAHRDEPSDVSGDACDLPPASN